jgi:hypothetical protein
MILGTQTYVMGLISKEEFIWEYLEDNNTQYGPGGFITFYI